MIRVVLGKAGEMSSILVVDDDTNTREVLCRFLNAQGYHAISAANGWEALLSVEDHNVDLILLDVMMPGMDGVTFLKILRSAQRKQTTPVVLVTALGAADVRQRVANLGITEILPKTRALYDNLIDVLNRSLGEDQDPLAHRGN
jgi:CheY-like chemotaxis protein